MRKNFRPVQLLAFMLVLGSSFCFTACSDDDDVKNRTEITTSTMNGDYKGKMTSWNINNMEGEDNGEEVVPGMDISATVENNTIHLEKFPIKDIVLSIVKDETLANNIVEAVGDINYDIKYEPALTTDKDSIMLKLNPEPLKLNVTIPATNEGEEAQTLAIEVKVEAGEKAGYAVEDGNMKFHIGATKVMIGEGEQQMELPGFVPTTFYFDMNQCKITPHF